MSSIDGEAKIGGGGISVELPELSLGGHADAKQEEGINWGGLLMGAGLAIAAVAAAPVVMPLIGGAIGAIPALAGVGTAIGGIGAGGFAGLTGGLLGNGLLATVAGVGIAGGVGMAAGAAVDAMSSPGQDQSQGQGQGRG